MSNNANAPASWEDEAEEVTQQAQNLNLNQQQPRQQQQQQPFRPNFNAASFQPGAQSFVPGQNWNAGGQQYGGYGGGGYAQQGYQGYQGGYQGQQQQQQYGGYQGYQGGGQQGGYQGYQGGGPGGYNQGGYQGYQGGYQQQQQQRGEQQQQQQQGYRAQQHHQQPFQPTAIAKKDDGNRKVENTPAPTPTAAATTTTTSAGASTTAAAAAPKEDAKPVVKSLAAATGGAAKVLTIGGSSSSSSSSAAAKSGAKAGASAADKATPEAGNKATAAKKISGEKTAGAAAKKAGSGNTSPAPPVATAATTAAAKAAEKREVDAVSKEQEADVDEATLAGMYGKEHVNVIFIGHVDAGKSSLGGAILYATGMVDERTMEKFKKDAKDAGRESWYLSWALDLTKEERAKGKTVEVGRAFFETEKRKYSILDAPGHKTFVPSMIGGASQADVGILVISARKGEYETGFEKGGQTREHAVLAKTQGVNKLIVVVNKMDDPTVEWSKERFDECTTKLLQFLKATGYNPKTDVTCMPVSALTGQGLKNRIDSKLCSWYNGPSLLEFLDNMQGLDRKVKAPFMMPVNGKYKDMGTMAEGKIESGVIQKGQTILMMPGRVQTEITAIYSESDEELPHAICGDQVRLRLRGVEEEDILPGYVLSSTRSPVNCVSAFEAQIHIIDLKSILTAGFSCVMHVHAAIEEVKFEALLHALEKGTGRKSKRPPNFAKKGQGIIARLETVSGNPFCIERFEDYAQMGRFTLRDQGQTIAIGKITKLIAPDA
ncbi:translation termination factor GTPase eRF3 [Orbilia blumenaviensis]|uniref:Elongation factor 1-alpha n=1 Tax=Orbilia blumenaviensis TaxID=1796055 RepID=A0AAV9UL89_9PEZI